MISNELQKIAGGMAEWLNAPVLKTGGAKRPRGFESHSLRETLRSLQEKTPLTERRVVLYG